MFLVSKLLIAIVFTVGVFVGFFIFNQKTSSFENLSSEEMREEIISERDLAIQKSVEQGNYRCCITPPCTMCYMEANQWNNFQAGTCACDDLIALGKEACHQCNKGLCESNNTVACKVD